MEPESEDFLLTEFSLIVELKLYILTHKQTTRLNAEVIVGKRVQKLSLPFLLVIIDNLVFAADLKSRFNSSVHYLGNGNHSDFVDLENNSRHRTQLLRTFLPAHIQETLEIVNVSYLTWDRHALAIRSPNFTVVDQRIMGSFEGFRVE